MSVPVIATSASPIPGTLRGGVDLLLGDRIGNCPPGVRPRSAVRGATDRIAGRQQLTDGRVLNDVVQQAIHLG